jgi:hypothetical protein
MTVWYVDVMWALMLLGIALWCGGCAVMNPALRAMRTMGLVSAYAVGAWMLYALPLRVALTTWTVFAAGGGALILLYELWARYKFSGTGRKPRPLILLQGFILWPALLPDAVEGMLVDLGVLPAARSGLEEPSAR